MSINDSYAKLTRSAKDLLADWELTKASWRDENSRQFEGKYMVTLHAELRKARLAMERMDALLNELKHDCR
jgi:hypothetical protein